MTENYCVCCSQAILDKATSHTKSVLQKTEEKAKALEKVTSFLVYIRATQLKVHKLKKNIKETQIRL